MACFYSIRIFESLNLCMLWALCSCIKMAEVILIRTFQQQFEHRQVPVSVCPIMKHFFNTSQLIMIELANTQNNPIFTLDIAEEMSSISSLLQLTFCKQLCNAFVDVCHPFRFLSRCSCKHCKRFFGRNDLPSILPC